MSDKNNPADIQTITAFITSNTRLARLVLAIIRSPRLFIAVEAISRKIAIIDAAERGGEDLRNYKIVVGLEARGRDVTHFADLVDADGGRVAFTGGGAVQAADPTIGSVNGSR